MSLARSDARPAWVVRVPSRLESAAEFSWGFGGCNCYSCQLGENPKITTVESFRVVESTSTTCQWVKYMAELGFVCARGLGPVVAACKTLAMCPCSKAVRRCHDSEGSNSILVAVWSQTFTQRASGRNKARRRSGARARPRRCRRSRSRRRGRTGFRSRARATSSACGAAPGSAAGS